MTSKKTRVAIYARVSTTDKGQDPENQLKELRTWCKAQGHVIAGEYVDKESDRTKAGLARAKKEGRIGGRPRATVSKTEAATIRTLHKDGSSERKIVEEINRRRKKEDKLSRTAVRRVLTNAGGGRSRCIDTHAGLKLLAICIIKYLGRKLWRPEIGPLRDVTLNTAAATRVAHVSQWRLRQMDTVRV